MKLNNRIMAAAFALIVLTTAGLFGQLDLYKVPKLTPVSGDRNASIAANNLGDIMVVYTTTTAGATFTFRAHGGTTWTAPKAIPSQNYSDYIRSVLYWTDVTPTADNSFHAIWAVDSHLSEGYGLYYAAFNPTSSQWTAPVQLLTGRIGEPKLITNQLTDELILIWDWYLESGATKNKDVFIKVRKSGGWQPEVNISQLVTDSSDVFDAPHGQLAETNTAVAVDESDGYIYLAYKEDQYVQELDDAGKEPWELRIHVVLLDPSYKMVWNEQVTANYTGFHFLPSIAALNGKAIVMLAWPQEVSYNYIIFTREGQKLTYDSHVLEDNVMARVPTIVNRWYAWHNKIHAHGDEIVATYTDDALYTTMRLMKNWLWKSGPIDLSRGEREFYYPFDSYADPKIGILTAFHNFHEASDDDAREELAEICVTIYHYPKAVVHAATNITIAPQVERSFFQNILLNKVGWQNHQLNINRGVTVSTWRVYRKLKTEAVSSYVRIGETDGATYFLVDPKSVPAVNPYDYFVTGVDASGNESPLPK